MIEIWTIGNTGLRSANRAQEGLRVYANSSLCGNIHGKEAEIKLEKLLRDASLIGDSNQSSDGTYGRKWRLAWCRSGFIYAKFKKVDGLTQNDIGRADHITPFGRKYIEAETLAENQDLFLRQMIVPLFLVDNHKYYLPFDWRGKEGKFFSPLLWTIEVLLKLEERTGEPAIKFEEFALFVQTSDPTHDINTVVNSILDLRNKKNQSNAKKRFNNKAYELYGKDYAKKPGNFKEYGDANLRYLRQTGIFARNGRGIAIRKECKSLAIQLVHNHYDELSLSEKLRILYEIPPLPTDDISGAKKALDDMLAVFKEKGICYDLGSIDLHDVVDVNHARMSMQEMLAQTNEKEYAAQQCNQWKEINEYMKLIYGKEKQSEEFDISVPRDNEAAYLEWIIWRSFLAIDSLVNQPDQVRSFKIDQDMMPVNTAPGNRPDLLAEFEQVIIVGEVTLSSGSRQEAMEGEPVRRHVANQAIESEKAVYGLFIANRIDTNTAETFRRGIWYLKDDSYILLNIVPFTLKQYQMIFNHMFEKKKAVPMELIKLMKLCSKHREESTAPEWKHKIDYIVNEYIELC